MGRLPREPRACPGAYVAVTAEHTWHVAGAARARVAASSHLRRMPNRRTAREQQCRAGAISDAAISQPACGDAIAKIILPVHKADLCEWTPKNAGAGTDWCEIDWLHNDTIQPFIAESSFKKGRVGVQRWR